MGLCNQSVLVLYSSAEGEGPEVAAKTAAESLSLEMQLVLGGGLG